MTWLDEPPLPTVFRRRENDGEPVNDRRLRSRLARGELVRIAPGSFAETSLWRGLTPIERHAQRVWEIAARLRPGQVITHFAAAALQGIDILGRWPKTLDVSIPATSGGRSSGSIHRHGRNLDRLVAVPWGQHFVTTPLCTTIDLISGLRLIEGVAAADQALWALRPSGALVAAGELMAEAAASTGRGAARARRAAGFATDRSDSVRESQSRVLISLLGFPDPQLQARFVLSHGAEAFTDFFWPDHRHIGEFDGAGKYRDPAMLRGRTPEQVLLDEKDREDELRRQVRAFSRWRVPALQSPRMLYDILTRAGLPTARPRPGR